MKRIVITSKVRNTFERQIPTGLSIKRRTPLVLYSAVEGSYVAVFMALSIVS